MHCAVPSNMGWGHTTSHFQRGCDLPSSFFLHHSQRAPQSLWRKVSTHTQTHIDQEGESPYYTCQAGRTYVSIAWNGSTIGTGAGGQRVRAPRGLRGVSRNHAGRQYRCVGVVEGLATCHGHKRCSLNNSSAIAQVDHTHVVGSPMLNQRSDAESSTHYFPHQEETWTHINRRSTMCDVGDGEPGNTARHAVRCVR